MPMDDLLRVEIITMIVIAIAGLFIQLARFCFDIIKWKDRRKTDDPS